MFVSICELIAINSQLTSSSAEHTLLQFIFNTMAIYQGWLHFMHLKIAWEFHFHQPTKPTNLFSTLFTFKFSPTDLEQCADRVQICPIAVGP